MAYKLQTNEGTHPAHPEWVTRSTHETRSEAEAELQEQSFAESVDGKNDPTTFGLNGVRIIET